MQLLAKCDVLAQLVSEGQALDAHGKKVKIHSCISPVFAEALYQTILKISPTLVVEVGMAFGMSSLAILAALQELGGDRRLISIDPHQKQQWQNCGVTSVKRAGFEAHHQLMEEPSYLALPKLLAKSTVIDFGYIDGWHTFDGVMVDFCYLDKMLCLGGTIAFNDCNWPAVHKAIRFALTHRRYNELDVGLPSTLTKDILRHLMYLAKGGSPILGLPRSNDRYFKKIDDWQPNWDYFSNF